MSTKTLSNNNSPADSPCSTIIPAKRKRGGSTDSKKSTETQEDDTTFVIKEVHFPAENLYEYQWPADSNGEWWMIQEQISEFLGVNFFKRKYPDLERRRILDLHERTYLREKGAVTEMQLNLGLTALKSDKVSDLMLKDYPEKYGQYAKVLHDRERQSISNKHQQYQVPSIDASKIKDYIKKAVKRTAEYNAQLNAELKEERRAYFDMNTLTTQVPYKRYKTLNKEATKPGAYPVTLIPGQFQDYYRKYNPDELKYLPLNSVMYGPTRPFSQSNYALPSEEDISSSEEDSNFSESVVPPLAISTEGSDSSSSSSDNDSTEGSDDSMPSQSMSDESEKEYKPKDIPDAICGICIQDRTQNKRGEPEEMIHCSQCDNSGHPSCLDMSPQLVQVIQTYPWQCMECKNCTVCGDLSDEKKILFCDACDRGYHTFCVGLKAIPTGRWVCTSCTKRNAPSTRSSRGRRRR